MGDQSIIKQVKKYKLVFIGDQSVGKTSIINRFISESFAGTQIFLYKKPTVGIDFVAKTLHIDNKTIRLQLWDTAGQERFRSLIPSYIRESDAAIIVYDITNPTSFANVNKWLEYVGEERGDGVLVFLLGNKSDLLDQREVQTSIGQQFAKDQGLHFFEVSAKEGTNINDTFKNVAHLLLGIDKLDPSSNDNDTNQSSNAKTNSNKQSSNGGGTIQLSSESNASKSQEQKCQC